MDTKHYLLNMVYLCYCFGNKQRVPYQFFLKRMGKTLYLNKQGPKLRPIYVLVGDLDHDDLYIEVHKTFINVYCCPVYQRAMEFDGIRPLHEAGRDLCSTRDKHRHLYGCILKKHAKELYNTIQDLFASAKGDKNLSMKVQD